MITEPILFARAHTAIGTVVCGWVKQERTMNGDFSVTLAVPAIMTICGTFACAAIGAAASASGVRPKPASTSAPSLATSSWAMRRVMSATPVSSRTISSILRPATVSPASARNSRAPASSMRPVEVVGPVIGAIRPILTGFACAPARRGANPATAARPAPFRT